MLLQIECPAGHQISVTQDGLDQELEASDDGLFSCPYCTAMFDPYREPDDDDQQRAGEQPGEGELTIE